MDFRDQVLSWVFFRLGIPLGLLAIWYARFALGRGYIRTKGGDVCRKDGPNAGMFWFEVRAGYVVGAVLLATGSAYWMMRIFGMWLQRY